MKYRCVFEVVSEDPPKSRCVRCGFIVSIVDQPIYCSCKVQDPCVHIGAVTGEIDVRLCHGQVAKRSTLACAVHGACVPMSPSPKGMACCEKCGDWLSASESVDAVTCTRR